MSPNSIRLINQSVDGLYLRWLLVEYLLNQQYKPPPPPTSAEMLHFNILFNLNKFYFNINDEDQILYICMEI